MKKENEETLEEIIAKAQADQKACDDNSFKKNWGAYLIFAWLILGLVILIFDSSQDYYDPAMDDYYDQAAEMALERSIH